MAYLLYQIRADTAEYLYLVLQSKDLGRDTDEVENVLLETEWYESVYNPFRIESCLPLTSTGHQLMLTLRRRLVL